MLMMVTMTMRRIIMVIMKVEIVMLKTCKAQIYKYNCYVR